MGELSTLNEAGGPEEGGASLSTEKVIPGHPWEQFLSLSVAPPTAAKLHLFVFLIAPRS